ncbi:MAG: hypothetical protein ACW99U_21185 [Candidatus Thorarchaeota archaeon]
MPVRIAGQQLRFEDWASPGAGPTIRYYYFYEPTSGKWLSTHESTLHFGRSTTSVNNEFLRLVGNVTSTSTRGYRIPHDFTITSMTGNNDAVAADKEVNFWVGGSEEATVNWTGLTVESGLDIDGDNSANVSLEIDTVPAGVPTHLSRPNVLVFFRWRLD